MTTITSAPVPATMAPATQAPAPTTDRARLHQAAQAFEAIFVREMLTTARAASVGDTPWGNDQGNETFNSMRDERFADLTARSGAIGLSRQIEAQLTGSNTPAAAQKGPRP
ncbi:rod-binding protein [Novosphingobium sp.]|uniref:rod-binding protein n=1 Tax=Novosphingobium sp. TaxID=1874826 RepID=UPI0033426675